MKVRGVSSFLLGIYLAGCTPYQSSGFAGGYTETWLAPDVVRVNFSGNGYTSGERTSDYALLRVAEIAKSRNYPFFILIDDDTERSSYITPSTYTASQFGDQVSIQETGGGTVTKSKSGLTAQMLPAKVSGAGRLVFDAQFICNSIAEKYQLTGDTQPCVK